MEVLVMTSLRRRVVKRATRTTRRKRKRWSCLVAAQSAPVRANNYVVLPAGEAAQGEVRLSRACGHGRWARYSGSSLRWSFGRGRGCGFGWGCASFKLGWGTTALDRGNKPDTQICLYCRDEDDLERSLNSYSFWKFEPMEFDGTRWNFKEPEGIWWN